MIQLPSTTSSSLLDTFKNLRPGDIFNIASKAHLISGYKACKVNTLTNAFWKEDKTKLVISFLGAREVTLTTVNGRLSTTCSCPEWAPVRNCPHIVIAWATLKQIVSPDTLSHIIVDPQMIQDLRRYIKQDPHKKGKALKILEETGRIANEQLARDAEKTVASTCRLILKQKGSSIRGAIWMGAEQMDGWTVSRYLPVDLKHFLASNRIYRSSRQYFDAFSRVNRGAYPINFVDEEGRETTLVYKRDEPCSAGITFDIRGDEVHISRSFSDGAPLPACAVIHKELLLDVTAGIVVPIANRDAWETWDAVFRRLSGTEDDFDEHFGASRPGGHEVRNAERILEPVAPPPGIRTLGHSIIAKLASFNSAAIRFAPELIDNRQSYYHFLMQAVPLKFRPINLLNYLLDIPLGLTGPTAVLLPTCQFEDVALQFYAAPFRLFNPYHRPVSNRMKAQKRLRAVIEAAFALLDETDSIARQAIIDSLTASPDLPDADLKQEGKNLLTSLSQAWDQATIITAATPGGWLFLRDEHRSQARLMRILYEFAGLDCFVNRFIPVTAPVTVEIATAKVLQALPSLMKRLQKGGFTLRISSEPLAEAKWEFSLDATCSSQDWFELKPEIRCNGEILTEGELSGLSGALLVDGVMLRRDGSLMLLDEVDARVLAMFAGALQPEKKLEKGEPEPVRVPRLQILDWLQLRSHGVEVRLSADDTRILESLLNFSSIPKRPLPQGLTVTLRHYQTEAWCWLAFLYEHRFGACLADDMGLGKTVQGITLLAGILSGELATTAPPGAPHLVVAPPSLLFNWEAELARFLPAARVLIYSGSERSMAEFAAHDVIITSYGIVQREYERLSERRFNVLIFDETQVVKNLQGATSNAVRKLQGAFTLALTGTPVENHLGEYYAIMDLCLPGLLGTREEFTRKIHKDGAAGTARLIGRTRPFVLRRTKELIARELPPKIEMDIHLELSTKQRAFYQRTVEEVRGKIQDAYESHAPAQAHIIALTAILRLRQICLAPALASPGAADASPKLEFLAEQLVELRNEGHSALVFSQFTGYLNLIEKALREQGFACLRLDGSTPVAKRKKLVQDFQESSQPTVFLISLKAGGRGLNLTRATYVYHMDPWWNPAVENQASDRAHRIGQTEQVTITRLIMRHTIEEKMMALKSQKLQLYKAILENGAGGGGAGLTRQDFEFLLA